MEKKEQTKTALQRLEGLESAASLLDQAIANLTTNLQNTMDAFSALSTRVEAIIRCGSEGLQINGQNISAKLIEIHTEDLKAKINDLVEKGLAVSSEEIKENSFVVGRELDPQTNELANPRIQFPLFGLKKELKEKLLGKRFGDTVQVSEGRNILEVMEIYDLTIPSLKASTDAAPAEASAEDAAAAAPTPVESTPEATPGA